MGIKKIKYILIALLILGTAGGVSGTYYYSGKYQEIQGNPNTIPEEETKKTIADLGKLMELPKEEIPTVATVSDKEKLKWQVFFEAAENGDILFAYTTAMKAILYRPSTKKIINVGPISVNPGQNLVQGAGIKNGAIAPRIAYYNGTRTIGLSGLAEKAIKEKYPDWQTAALTNAAKKDYTQTLVVDISKKYSQEASSLAQLFGGKVVNLPQGETQPDADILVISGK